MAKLKVIKGVSRKKIAGKTLDAINEIGEDRIIAIVPDEAGKIIGLTARNYIYYKN